MTETRVVFAERPEAGPTVLTDKDDYALDPGAIPGLIDRAELWRERGMLKESEWILHHIVMGGLIYRRGPDITAETYARLRAAQIGTENMLLAIGHHMTLLRDWFLLSNRTDDDGKRYRSGIYRLYQQGHALAAQSGGRAKPGMRKNLAMLHYRFAQAWTEQERERTRQFDIGLDAFAACMRKTSPAETEWPEFASSYALALAKVADGRARPLILKAIDRHGRNRRWFAARKRLWHWMIIQAGLHMNLARIASMEGDDRAVRQAMRRALATSNWLKLRGYFQRHKEYLALRTELGQR